MKELISKQSLYNIDPFLESRYEVSSGNSRSWLATAAAEYIITTAAYFPAASYILVNYRKAITWLLLVLLGYNDSICEALFADDALEKAFHSPARLELITIIRFLIYVLVLLVTLETIGLLALLWLIGVY
jgi:hypothetical protein